MKKYNYNTHTYKSNYKALYSVDEIVKEYEKCGFKAIGISDNIVMPYDVYNKLYLHPLEIKNYIKEINKVKKKHRSISINVGFICNYDIKYSKYLLYLKSVSDFMALSTMEPEDNTYYSYPKMISENICCALETGLFDFVVHPDIFLKFRDKVTDKKRYMKECDKALDAICLKAKKYDIPLELNLKYLNNIKIMQDDDYPYPTKMFINKLIKYKNICITGIDMTNLSDIKKYETSINKLEKMYPTLNINKSYNLANSNKALEKKLKSFKNKAKSYEYYIVKIILEKTDYNASIDEYIETINSFIKKTKNNYSEIINTMKKNIEITENSILNIDLKQKVIKRYKEHMVFNRKTFENKINILNDIIIKIKKLSNNNNKLRKRIKDYYSNI